MKNYIINTLAYNKQVRILFIDNTDIVMQLCKDKNMNKLLKTILSRTVSIASLITRNLKENQRISLTINPTDRRYQIFADADSLGNVRGYINDELLNVSLDNISIEQLMGSEGYIQVTKDIGMEKLFTGVTEMKYGNIVDDFSYYFKQSEQTSSLFSLNIVFDKNNEIVLSRGIYAELLPGAPVELIDNVKKIISDNESLLYTLQNDKTFQQIVSLLFKDIEILEIDPIQFFCNCSKDFFSNILSTLDKEELVEAYENNKPIEIVCNRCGKKYEFSKDEIKKFI
jgi:molecular chaperone Hsp33